MSRRRGYFKHRNDAHRGASIQNLYHAKLHDAVALFWHLVGEINAQKDEIFRTTLTNLSKDFGQRKDKLLKTISALSQEQMINFSRLSGEELEIFLPNRAKSLETRNKNGPPSKDLKIERSKDLKKINKKNDFNKGIAFETDLERIAGLYPRTDGLAGGITEAKFKIKSHNELADLISAISNYKKYLEQNRTEFRFIKTFKNFIVDDYWKAFIKTSTPGESFDDSMAEYDRLLKERGNQ